MLTPSHIASSYLLAQIPGLFGLPLTGLEIGVIIFAGNVVDIDFVVGMLFGKKGDDHHAFVTHTPIAVIAMWAVALMFLSDQLRPSVWLLSLCAGLLHLILDDVGYWFYRWGWQKLETPPQIDWFYPFQKLLRRPYEGSNINLVRKYISEGRVNVIVEIFLICCGASVWYFTLP